MDAPIVATAEPLVAEVAIDGAHLGNAGVLSYSVPARWPDGIEVGRLVWAPVKRRLTLGVVTRLHHDPTPFALKPLHAPVEPAFRLGADQLAIAGWLARETATSLFAAISPFLPPGVSHRAVEHLRLAAPPSDPAAVTPAQRRLLDLLGEKGELSVEAARAALGSSLTTVIARLEALGAIERVVRIADHTPHPRVQRFVRLVAIGNERGGGGADARPAATRRRRLPDAAGAAGAGGRGGRATG